MNKKILFLIKNERNQRYGILALAAYLKEKGYILDYVFANNIHALAGTTKNETLAKFKEWS